MTIVAALLRGVNVGGKTTLPMAELRKLATGLGYEDAATYIQSGNLLFRTSDPAGTVSKDLAAAIAGLGGVQPAVLVRTLPQLRQVVEGNPFLRRGEDPSSCHVVFAERATAGSLRAMDLDGYGPEEAIASGKELYLFLPGGVGRSKLAGDLAKDKAAVGTMRSWRTVTKLLEMAEAI
jgi:uncharacterized protein (DUF1697 family)